MDSSHRYSNYSSSRHTLSIDFKEFANAQLYMSILLYIRKIIMKLVIYVDTSIQELISIVISRELKQYFLKLISQEYIPASHIVVPDRKAFLWH